jgi:hypothetical protein
VLAARVIGTAAVLLSLGALLIPRGGGGGRAGSGAGEAVNTTVLFLFVVRATSGVPGTVAVPPAAGRCGSRLAMPPPLRISSSCTSSAAISP